MEINSLLKIRNLFLHLLITAKIAIYKSACKREEDIALIRIAKKDSLTKLKRLRYLDQENIYIRVTNKTSKKLVLALEENSMTL